MAAIEYLALPAFQRIHAMARPMVTAKKAAQVEGQSSTRHLPPRRPPRDGIGRVRSNETMNAKLLAAAAFVIGAVLSALVTALLVFQWHQAQSQLLWTSALQKHLRFATQVHQGDLDALRASLDRKLPGLVLAVASFGQNEQTLPLLRSTREMLLNTRREIPNELQSTLRGL